MPLLSQSAYRKAHEHLASRLELARCCCGLSQIEVSHTHL